MVLVLTMASNPFVGLAPFYVAMDKGFFKDCGLDFSMVDFDDSSASCSALLAGKVDLAYTTLDAAIIAESQYEEDMLDVTAIVDESAGADGILVKNDINSIADLKGKTVGVSINQTSHYLLMQALETAGLTDADVDLVNMTSSDAGVSFISGDLDAAVTWEPDKEAGYGNDGGSRQFLHLGIVLKQTDESCHTHTNPDGEGVERTGVGIVTFARLARSLVPCS